MTTLRFAWAALSASLAAALGGCVSLPTQAVVEIAEPTAARPVAAPVTGLNNGSIFQGQTYRPLFEDHRARLVGDTITVQIAEKVAASAKSTSSVERGGTLSGSVTALPMLPGSISSRLLPHLSVGGTSSNVFDGKGGTENTNTFSGTITATVIEVLPNGHLLIGGEKQIGVNHNVDVLRFSGQVDPRAIQPGNSVSSAQIANVRIEQRGRGALGDAQQTGWMSRFFLSLSPI